MAIELIRQCWCDIHLKKYKERVEGNEAAATLVHDGRFVQVDACEDCAETLSVMDVVTWGYYIEKPKAEAKTKKRGRPQTAPKKVQKTLLEGTRSLVECSLCGKQVTSGSGWGLHNNAHKRRGETKAEALVI